ncbi:MAG: type II secretion system protein [Candidatus Brocadiia bacterium]|nr:MAG: type II secretion system protein [Candidatus Brocadiia bacterium]
MKKAFSLLEILIVTAILGILAAIIVPVFQGNSAEAKSTAAKENLRILRGVIELYTLQHGGTPPGYLSNLATSGIMIPNQLTRYSDIAGVTSVAKDPAYPCGPYIKKMPVNPFNNKNSIYRLGNDSSFPETPTGSYGWLYKPATKEIKIDYDGCDKNGSSYYGY